MPSFSYLDAPSESGSLSIVNSLGLTFLTADDSSVPFFQIRELTMSSYNSNDKRVSELLREHKSSSSKPIRYVVSEGTVYVDIRDSVDAWLRCTLLKNDSIELSPSLYRRFDFPVGVDARFLELSIDDSLCYRFMEKNDSLAVTVKNDTRELVCELCRQFFVAGWVMGTGGSISIRFGNRIYMTPSGVQKERIKPDELYVLDVNGAILFTPTHKSCCPAPKLSDCSPLFLHAFKQRNAGAVLHSHHINCNIATSLFDGQSEFRISHQEMIKGLTGYGYFDELVIPIIENTAWEHELADSLGDTMRNYPKASAILVRRHGMYVWGATWEQAKRHAECLHYLFDVAIEMRKLGMNFLAPPATITPDTSYLTSPVSDYDTQARKRLKVEEDGTSTSTSLSNNNTNQLGAFNNNNNHNGIRHCKYILLDIEGTTTPISFVKDVLFPYAHEKVEEYLTATWDTAQTREDVRALVEQAQLDARGNVPNIPRVQANPRLPKDQQIYELVQYVQWNIVQDKKITALKQLQGHIWAEGYANGQIQSIVYDDVPVFLARMKVSGISVTIYSSGSRAAQRLLFKNTNHGDLRPFISCYFDTTIGHKRTSSSYQEIALSLGVDSLREVLFVTDIAEEAQAARDAGMEAVLAVRPGNATLPSNHGFGTVSTFDEL